MNQQDLEILLEKFKLFTQKLNKRHLEFEIILERYNYYKKKVQMHQRNGHYIDCVSYNDAVCEACLTDDIVCSCYYIKEFPARLCKEIINLIDFDYIANF